MLLVEVEDASRYRMEATIAASAVAARGLKRGTRARAGVDGPPGRAVEGTGGGDGMIQLRLGTLGRSFPGDSGERVEILSGIDAGETVVLDPGTRNLDGRKLEAGR